MSKNYPANMAEEVEKAQINAFFDGEPSHVLRGVAIGTAEKLGGVRIYNSNDGLNCRNWSIEPEYIYKMPDGSFVSIGCSSTDPINKEDVDYIMERHAELVSRQSPTL